MKKTHWMLLILITLITLSSPAQTQEEISFSIGDTLVFGTCDSATYTYIDYFSKTRIEPGERHYNKETGEGFYQYYFGTGDFDVKKLAKSYQGKECVIVSFQDVKDDKGNERTIVLASVESELRIAWIEMQPALESGEIVKKKKRK